MGKYTAMPCAHCNNTFKDGDDVVVCPVCGAPHHRDCYREVGHCALQEKHGDGFVWQAPVDHTQHKDTVRCKHCGTVNQKENKACQHCGSPLAEERPSLAPHGFAPRMPELHSAGEFEVDGITAREISAYVGNGAFYFMRQFQGMLSGTSSVSWNWFAFFFRYVYFFYRRMYAVGFAVLGLSLPAMISSLLYSIELFKVNSMEFFGVQLAHNPELLALLSKLAPFVNGYSFLLAVACGLFANRLYLRKVISDIGALRESGGNPAGGGEYYATLYLMGKPNFLAVLLIIASFFFLYSSIGAHLVSLMGL